MPSTTLGTLIQQWSGPAGFMVLFGGIVWGIQLNMAVLDLTRGLKENHRDIDDVRTSMVEISNNTLKTSIILAELQKDTEHTAQMIEQHNQEAEQWKRRITILEERTRQQ